ncbi:MAG TPA: hypothetical protein PLB01_00155 [Thermoanaerobaculia bacterium]|nr:hypothetical protein [Thermoanaerobaculia bacterium]
MSAAEPEQVGLFDGVEDTRLEREFRRFHFENPEVYRELVALARRAKQHSRNRYGIGALFEVLRWNRMLSTTGDDFKLNNNHRAYYAREIMRREPDLSDFFETRHVHGEEQA